MWLYYRFLLSYRDVEELLAERGIVVSYETVRGWCRKFGQSFADGVRRRRSRPGDKWHIDEVQLKIWPQALVVAGGGPARGGAGHPGAGVAQPGSRRSLPTPPRQRQWVPAA